MTGQRKPPAVYERDGRWYAKIKYPVGHQERPAGGWRNVPTGETHQARALLVGEELRARVERGLHAIDPQARGPMVPAALLTVADLCERFLQGHTRRRIKDIEAYRRAARYDLNEMVLPYLGSRAAAQLRRADVLAWLEVLRQRYAPATLNQALTRLSSVYTFALDHEILTCPHPCRGIESERTSAATDHLSHAECQAVLRLDPGTLRQELRPIWRMVVVCLYTGLRLGELVALPWEHIDLAAGSLLVAHNWTAARTPKSGQARTIPLHPELHLIMTAWRAAAGGPLVFGAIQDATRLGRRVAEVVTLAGAHVTRPRPWHGLRHSFATHLAEATGGNMDAVARILGHSGASVARVTLNYVHTSQGYLAAELAKLSYGMPRALAAPDELADARQRRARGR